jgi:ankyrin repeat protein
LFTAVLHGHRECAELLLGAGADITVKDNGGNLPYSAAVWRSPRLTQRVANAQDKVLQVENLNDLLPHLDPATVETEIQANGAAELGECQHPSF